MRKIIDEQKSWKVGDTRVRCKFLLLPRHFGRDWRWLEYAEVIEEYCGGGFTEPCFWIMRDFVDNRSKYIENIEKRQLEKNQ